MINRRFLYLGVFLVATGAVVLGAQAGLITGDAFARTLWLWPVALIAVGVALLLRRTRFGLAGGLIAAVLPGLLLGGAVVAAPTVSFDCRPGEPSSYATTSGTLVAPAQVSVDLSCGDVEVTVTPGSDWQIQTGETGAPAPTIDASGSRLSLRSARRPGPFGYAGADVWRVSLPNAQPIDLDATVNAGKGRYTLSGATLGKLNVTVNAGDARMDLTGATTERLDVTVNAGAATVLLPEADDLSIEISANAGEVMVCVPGDLGVQLVRRVAVLGSTSTTGLTRTGDVWHNPTNPSPTHHANVTLAANVGSVELKPEGGCK
jgi:hypothetical protein